MDFSRGGLITLVIRHGQGSKSRLNGHCFNHNTDFI